MFMTEKKGDNFIINLTGELNENTDFSKIPLEPTKCLVLDLKYVKMLNSSGLRSWVIWISKIDSETQIILRNCPPVVVNQLNILEGFLPIGAIVESIYVPYYCENCEHEENILALRGKDYLEKTKDANAKQYVELKKQCPECYNAMELAASKDKFFNFLKYYKD